MAVKNIAKKNERNAGRKPAISAEKLDELKQRRDAGESITVLAKENGVSRQTLRSVEVSEYTMRMDFEELITLILSKNIVIRLLYNIVRVLYNNHKQ